MTTLFPKVLKSKQSKQSELASSSDLKQSKVYPATERGCHLFLPPTKGQQTWEVWVGREHRGESECSDLLGGRWGQEAWEGAGLVGHGR